MFPLSIKGKQRKTFPFLRPLHIGESLSRVASSAPGNQQTELEQIKGKFSLSCWEPFDSFLIISRELCVCIVLATSIFWVLIQINTNTPTTLYHQSSFILIPPAPQQINSILLDLHSLFWNTRICDKIIFLPLLLSFRSLLVLRAFIISIVFTSGATLWGTQTAKKVKILSRWFRWRHRKAIKIFFLCSRCVWEDDQPTYAFKLPL